MFIIKSTISLCIVLCFGFAESAQQRTSSSNGNSRISYEQDRTDVEDSTPKPPLSSSSRRTALTLRPGHDTFRPEQLEAIDNYIYKIDDLKQQYSIVEVGLMAVTTKIHAQIYNDLLIHRYDNFNELRQSGGPLVDQELCLSQLNDLKQRAETQLSEKYGSKDLNFFKLLDTFGRVPSGLLLGNSFWTGMYNECLRLKIDAPTGKLSTRYCVASITPNTWISNTTFGELATLSSAACLPIACDSVNYKNKYELVHRLIQFNSRDMDKNQTTLTGLYCLPDAESPSRIWWHSRGTVAVVFLLSAWIFILFYSTMMHKILGNQDSYEQDEKPQKHGLTSSFGLDTRQKTNESKQITPTNNYINIYKSLSITNNLSLLFNTSKTSTLLEADDKLNENKHQNGLDEQPKIKSIIDLRILEGIKVICMSYVIMGHVLMCLTVVMMNGGELLLHESPFFIIANMMPAFAVNSFFTITGLLTCYLLFKQNRSHSFMTSPIKWFAFILYRYLRIMPMYLVVVLYCKYLARYMGSGPFWDYGTSSLAQRKMCEQESWFWTILFGANFKHPLEHCIPAAWYLANDFQFFIITPIFLAALYKRPKFGKILITFCILASYLANFLSVFYSGVDDLRPVARFSPHGFQTYLTQLSFNYTQPQYRIPSYLLGLLIGFALYNFEQDKIKYMTDKMKPSNTEDKIEEPEWPNVFKKYGVSASVFLITSCCMTPLIAAKIPFNKLWARIMTSLVMPTYHLGFSLAIGMYIILATTGYGNKYVNSFLSASFWKPLARLSLCAVLINVEVITYITQSQKHLQYVDSQYLLSLNVFCIFVTYVVSIVMCVLFEAPMRAALNHLLTFTLTRMAFKQKGDLVKK